VHLGLESTGAHSRFTKRRFKSEVQQCSIDDMAE
jgi:hypothetical protein